MMIVDEFGIFRADQHWFGLKGQPVSIAGRGLVLGRPESEDGGFTPCQLGEKQVEDVIHWFDDPAEAEALVPPTLVTTKPGGRGKVLERIPAKGFRTMKKELVTREGKVIPYVPTT